MSFVGTLILGALVVGLDVGVARFTYGLALPQLQHDLRLSFTAAGLIGALHLCGYMAGTLLTPRLVRRFTLRELVAYSQLAFGAVLVANGLGEEALWFGLERVLLGIAAGVGVSCMFAICLEISPGRRVFTSAVLWSGPGFAIAANGLAIPAIFAGEAVWRLAYLVPGFISMAAACFVPMGKPHPGRGGEAAPEKQVSPGEWRNCGWLIASYFWFGFGYLAFVTFITSRLAVGGLGASQIGTFWVFFSAASIVGGVLGAIAQSFRRLKDCVLVAGFALGAIGALLSREAELSMVLVGALFVGLGVASTPAVITAVVRERTTQLGYLRVFSFATAATALGQVLGPVSAGVLADLQGPRAVPALASAAYAVGIACAVLDAVTTRR